VGRKPVPRAVSLRRGRPTDVRRCSRKPPRRSFSPSDRRLSTVRRLREGHRNETTEETQMVRRTSNGMVRSRDLLLIVVAAGAGCSSSSPAHPPMDASAPTLLDPNGCFSAGNGAGIVGCWYAYGDWYGSAAGAPAGAGDCGTNMGNFTVDQ